jgi:hypothetical protein
MAELPQRPQGSATVTAVAAPGAPRRREADVRAALALGVLLVVQIAISAACVWLVHNQCALSIGQLLGGFTLLCAIDGVVLVAFRAVVARKVASSPQVVPDARRAARTARSETDAPASADRSTPATPSWLPKTQRAT